VTIEGTFEDGLTFDTILPLNLHAANRLIGYKKCDPKGFKHYTMPLKWSLFGIQEFKECNTEKGLYEYIHFDHSLSSASLRIGKKRLTR
jgi:hypothetical protein